MEKLKLIVATTTGMALGVYFTKTGYELIKSKKE